MGTLLKRYAPEVSVTAVCWNPVTPLAMRTCAPTISAPEGSVTTPWTVPLLMDWPYTEIAARPEIAIRQRKSDASLIPALCDALTGWFSCIFTNGRILAMNGIEKASEAP